MTRKQPKKDHKILLLELSDKKKIHVKKECELILEGNVILNVDTAEMFGSSLKVTYTSINC